MDSGHKKRKINWFKLKKIVFSTVRRDQFFYISFKFDYKVISWWLQFFSLSFSIPFSHCPLLPLYSLPFYLYPPRANQMVGFDPCPISTFLKSLCSSCKAENHCSCWKPLFRYHFHINAARELAAEHLMRWQQLSFEIFHGLLLSSSF